MLQVFQKERGVLDEKAEEAEESWLGVESDVLWYCQHQAEAEASWPCGLRQNTVFVVCRHY
jgi:hypothetical protein